MRTARLAAAVLIAAALAFPAGAMAARANGPTYEYPLYCGSDGPLTLVVLSGSHLGWDATDGSSRFLIRVIEATYHDFGDQVRSQAWGKYDPATAWTCDSGGPFTLQGFSITITRMVLVPLP